MPRLTGDIYSFDNLTKSPMAIYTQMTLDVTAKGCRHNSENTFCYIACRVGARARSEAVRDRRTHVFTTQPEGLTDLRTGAKNRTSGPLGPDAIWKILTWMSGLICFSEDDFPLGCAAAFDAFPFDPVRAERNNSNGRLGIVLNSAFASGRSAPWRFDEAVPFFK